MSVKLNLAVADRIMAAFFSGDRQTIHALVADNFVLLPPRGSAHYGNYRGAEGFLSFVRTFGEAYDLQQADKTNAYPSEDGTVIVFELHLAGTVRASGVPFDTTLLEAWHFEGGKLVKIRPHWYEIPGANP
jgi:ketosteroid isomerase-like protein